jgi:lysophospholipase L1-like esterase
MWQSHLAYHPRIGFTYTPNFKARLPHESGGYLIRTNSAGFRSDHEFKVERNDNKFRILLFGDSQTAGVGVSNGNRYGDVLEKSIPDLEVFNYGLSGSGTDQQYLSYLEFGQVEHDLVIIGLYIEDVTRVNSRFLRFADANGKEVFYAKPYYVRNGSNLELNHVPVPKQPLDSPPPTENSISRMPHQNIRTVLRSLIPSKRWRHIATDIGITKLLGKSSKTEPASGYDTPHSPGWLLLSAVIEAWIRKSSVPVLLVPIPVLNFIERTRDPAEYQARFRELAAATGCLLHDPLPDFWEYPSDERRALCFKHDSHLSTKGHEALSRSLLPVIELHLRSAFSTLGDVVAKSGRDNSDKSGLDK